MKEICPAMMLANRMLTFPLRQYVIKDIKMPLMKVLLLTAGRFKSKFGSITKENTIQPISHILIDSKEEFRKHYYNSSRKQMMEASFDIGTFVVEHDPHYRWLFIWLLKRLKKEIEAGNLKLIDEPFPDNVSWKE